MTLFQGRRFTLGKMGHERGLFWLFVRVTLVTVLSATEGALPNATLGVLRELWEQTGGHQWSRCQWTPDLDPCAPPWGVFGEPHDPSACFVCNRTVTNAILVTIDLRSSNLIGPIPDSIGQLTTLQYLILSHNQLHSTIPESIGNLIALQELALGDNQLTGTIPESLGNLTALTGFGFFNNQLTGTIPNSLGMLTSLSELTISQNHLTGTIPESLGNLTALTYIGLHNNQLTGPIPEAFGNLTALTAISLGNNLLSGSIPETLARLTALTELALFYNQLTGAIPETFGSCVTLSTLALDNNQLTGAIPESLGNLTALAYLGLHNNRLTGTVPESFSNLTALLFLGVGGNPLIGTIPEFLGNLTMLTFLGLSYSQLTGTIPESLGSLTALTTLALSNGYLSGTIPESLGNLTALTSLRLNNNQLTGTVPESFARLSQLNLLDLQNNNLSDAVLTNLSVLATFQGSLSINLSGNGLSGVGPMFGSCTNPEGQLVIDISNNSISDGFLESSLASASRCASALTVDLSLNNITSVSFASLAGYTLRYCSVDPCPERHVMELILDVSNNPLRHFVTSPVSTQPLPPASYASALSVDLSFSTSTLDIDLQAFFSGFNGIPWNPTTGGTVNISLAGNPSVHPSVVQALSTAPNSPTIMNVNLSWNNYTALNSGVINGSRAASLDFSHNSITEVAADAVDYSFDLTSLHMSHNNITVLPISFLDRLPGLTDLTVNHNALVAIPATNNHLAATTNAAQNPLRCTSYGPTASGCSCPDGYYSSTFSGYVRCTLTPTGCPQGTLWNDDDESNAPWSTCITGSVPGQYFVNNTFLPITECSTYLASTGKQAYEVQPPGINADGTATSDRLCSLCSSCPTGYHATPCTEKSDTKCTQLLSPAAIAAIVLSIVLLLMVGMLGAGYGRTQKQQRYQTQTELELTERLLGDVQDEKERAIEEIADMEHAWAIAENDLGFGAVIGEGAYGRVFRGTWGHIPVAIKVLRHPLDEMDPTMRTDFDREVKFMRSIRHPHILIFYGAGVDTNSRAFLVTELMAGSLKTVLLNHQISLGWEARLTFAVDIASGMAYLHDRGTVHRDLKADNCFLSNDNRVKVADFGTGRIAKHIQDSSSTDTATTSFPTAVTTWSVSPDMGRTLSKGVGSLLWMAPEALRGSRLKDGQGPALDIYSFAIVLWEIWARARPWDEVQEQGIQFSTRLTELVNSGVRPQLPSDCEEAPAGYQALMEQCWAGRPDRRPPFTVIQKSLATISENPH